jgi:uncharacterized protein
LRSRDKFFSYSLKVGPGPDEKRGRAMSAADVSSAPGVPANQTAYDLSATLFASGRLFHAPLTQGEVFFNPDWRGFPIVVNDWVGDMLGEFANGAVVGSVLSQLPESVDLGLALDTIDFLEQSGFLRGAPTPARYRASEFSAENSKGMGIWVHVNNHCNLDCEYCFVNKFKSTMQPEVVARTVEFIRSTVESRGLKEVLIKFAGGEPTLSLPTMEDFYTRLTEALEPQGVRLNFGILSNGTVLHERLLEFLKRSKATMAISLDGHGAETHDIFRVFKNSRKGSWDKIIANIEVLKANAVPISINATISEQSCRSLPALVKWIAENGFRTRLGVVRQPNGSWSGGSREAEYERLTNAVNAAFDEALTELEKPEYEVELRNGLSICELHFETPTTTACCGIATNHIVIQDDGRLASCPMTTRESPVDAGPDLFSAARLTFPYKPEERNDSEEKNCLDCQWFPVCTSGCPVTNLRIKNKAFTISPLHAFYAFVIPRYVQFFGRKLLQQAQRRGVTDFAVLDFDERYQEVIQ